MLGCAALLAVPFALLIAKFRWRFLVIFGASVLVLASLDQVHRWRRGALVRDFRATYGAAGKDLLLVYTDSAHWRPYIEQYWLSRWADRTVALNRSRPWTSDQLEARLWRQVAGTLNHTPIAIVIPARGSIVVVRLFAAFRDYKHGKERRLRDAERELEKALAEASERAA